MDAAPELRPIADPLKLDDIAGMLAITVSSSHLVSAAIVGALAERGAVDPLKVAAWAEVFAGGQGADLPPLVRQGVQEQLRSFASIIRSMATNPAGAGRG